MRGRVADPYKYKKMGDKLLCNLKTVLLQQQMDKQHLITNSSKKLCPTTSNLSFLNSPRKRPSDAKLPNNFEIE